MSENHSAKVGEQTVKEAFLSFFYMGVCIGGAMGLITGAVTAWFLIGFEPLVVGILFGLGTLVAVAGVVIYRIRTPYVKRLDKAFGYQ